MFSSFRKHLDTSPTIGASFARPRVYDQISAQIFGLPSHLFQRINQSFAKILTKKSMLYTGCIQRVAHGVYTCNQILFMYLCDNFYSDDK